VNALPGKFRDPLWTAKGERRAAVSLSGLRTLWFNTGTLCYITCAHCYIESSPRNDALSYITAAKVRGFLEEAASHPLEEVGFTGGGPFMNPEFLEMLEDAMARGLRALVLTNAMRPMMLRREPLARLNARYPGQLTVRVSLDHYDALHHDAERGAGSFARAMEGLRWPAPGRTWRSPAAPRSGTSRRTPCVPASPACSPPRASRWTRAILWPWCCSPRWTRRPRSPRSPRRAGASSTAPRTA